MVSLMVNPCAGCACPSVHRASGGTGSGARSATLPAWCVQEAVVISVRPVSLATIWTSRQRTVWPAVEMDITSIMASRQRKEECVERIRNCWRLVRRNPISKRISWYLLNSYNILHVARFFSSCSSCLSASGASMLANLTTLNRVKVNNIVVAWSNPVSQSHSYYWNNLYRKSQAKISVLPPLWILCVAIQRTAPLTFNGKMAVLMVNDGNSHHLRGVFCLFVLQDLSKVCDETFHFFSDWILKLLIIICVFCLNSYHRGERVLEMQRQLCEMYIVQCLHRMPRGHTVKKFFSKATLIEHEKSLRTWAIVLYARFSLKYLSFFSLALSLSLMGNRCQKSCKTGTFYQEQKDSCEPCHSACATCSGTVQTNRYAFNLTSLMSFYNSCGATCGVPQGKTTALLTVPATFS